jgi:pimeloyl-ACP methyl ester carboxylesterase
LQSLETLRGRYGLPHSRYVLLDGVPVHYTDQGEGPVLVVVHGSFLDLTSYDDWIDAFAGYRILRYDRLRWGLTGHGEGPTISYDDEVALLAALVDHLGLDRFSLAGSSSGGMVAALFASRHQPQVERIALINFPLGHGRIRSADGSEAAVDTPLTANDRMRALLVRNFADPALVTEAMVTRFADLMDRADPGGAIAASYAHAALFGETERRAVLRSLAMPTLILWSACNRTLSVADGRAAFEAVGAVDKQFLLIEQAGHMLPLEKGAISGRAVRRFLAGKVLPQTLGG